MSTATTSRSRTSASRSTKLFSATKNLGICYPINRLWLDPTPCIFDCRVRTPWGSDIYLRSKLFFTGLPQRKLYFLWQTLILYASTHFHSSTLFYDLFSTCNPMTSPMVSSFFFLKEKIPLLQCSLRRAEGDPMMHKALHLPWHY